MKELFIKEVTTKMADFLDDNQRIRLREILTEICLNYQIQMKQNEIIFAQNLMSDLAQQNTMP